MQNRTKVSLGIAGLGFAIQQYEKKKTQVPNYYENYKPPVFAKYISEEQLKMLGGVVGIGGLASAAIFEKFKDNPKAIKISFITMGGVAIGFYFLIIMALKKMT